MADVRSPGDCPNANGDDVGKRDDDDEARSAGKELLLALDPSGFRRPRRSSRTEFRHAAMIACALVSRASSSGLVRLREMSEFMPDGGGGGGSDCVCSIARRLDRGRLSAASSSAIAAAAVAVVGRVQVVFRFRGLFRNRSHGSIDTQVEEGL